METKKLFQIVHEKSVKKAELSILKEEYEKSSKKLLLEIQALDRLESIGTNDINIDFVQIAESVIYVGGNPYGEADGGRNIADSAIDDIAKGCNHLKTKFFGNKEYGSYYQRNDCEYGYGPKHGSTVDEIGLKRDARERDLTDEEKDACIYYLRNYKKIRQLIPKK